MSREVHTMFLWIILIFIQTYTLSTNGREDLFGTSDTYFGKYKRATFGPSSFRQNPLVNFMMQTIAPNQSPNQPVDFLDNLKDKYPLPNGVNAPFAEYDYVIIGAGSAGCVLASRLTEDPNVTVLLLEVGKPEFALTDVPSIAPYFQRTEYTWPYFMEPQPGVCLGMINGRCYWPRGRAVGGTSVINYMIYTRGRPEEWDRIAAAGNYGWSYNDVLKYYMKSEHSNLKGLEDSPYHSRTGELAVNWLNYKTPFVHAFLEAGRILGHPTLDYNTPEQLGFGYLQVTAKLGRRVSAAKAFLHFNRNRPNLHILPDTRATKILIDPGMKTAYGVEYIRQRMRQTVTARREVIVSAGPIASPQLLMLSGIGPREHLNSHGIPVIQDLPVGRTLYDHISFPGLVFTLNTTGLTLNENADATLDNVLDWLQFGDGPVAAAGGAEGIGYIKTPGSDEPERIPDIELLSIGGSILSDGGPGGSKAVRRGMMINENIFDAIFGSIDNTEAWSAFLMLLHPKSNGRLELKNRNPFSHPRMFGNYLTDPRDVRAFIDGIRHVQALVDTPPFQRYGAQIHRASYPTCRTLKFDSDAYWECAVRTFTATLHHQIGTCRMGPVGDPQAVVDPELRVHGVDRLRVIDSSIIPRTTCAHTNAPAIMIGEKGADMLKATWANSQSDNLQSYDYDDGTFQILVKK
ncbi:glucose dehydrogenase [FAD, quinone]-like [Pectinophora gossypiella]|uniref:glucose dehydrogenase [FAD, quinone]-like n=1 Tax=Pectinophora gossypiella TaxID=13191 RepID=UPI00214E7ABB|nr:glucose dehydrogenase [FAD, quinone]-like [Pectinophora gossypiella]